MHPLTALLLSDGRPGSYHLAEGIVSAINRVRPVVITRLEVRRGRWSGKVLAVLINAGASPRWILKTVYGLDPSALPAADVIVSSGAETLPASISAARILNVPNIYYGSLRWFRPTDFALVLTSYAGNAVGPNHLMVLKPSSSIADAQPKPAARQLGPAKPPKVAGLLIGGATRGFDFADDYWQRLAQFVAASRKMHGTSWIISNSRRTPAAGSDAMAAIAAEIGKGGVRFIDVRKADSEPIRRLFEEAEAIVCSADSSTMVSEAISAMLPVVSVTPEHCTFTRNEQDYRRYLIANDWCRQVSILELSPERFLAEVGDIEPITQNPILQLAEKLQERLPGLF